MTESLSSTGDLIRRNKFRIGAAVAAVALALTTAAEQGSGKSGHQSDWPKVVDAAIANGFDERGFRKTDTSSPYNYVFYVRKDRECTLQLYKQGGVDYAVGWRGLNQFRAKLVLRHATPADVARHQHDNGFYEECDPTKARF